MTSLLRSAGIALTLLALLSACSSTDDAENTPATSSEVAAPQAKPGPTSADPTPTPLEDALFDVVAELPIRGRVSTAENYFVSVENGTLTTYAPDGKQVASSSVLSLECGVSVVGSGPERGHVLTAERVLTPAAGLKPEAWDLVLRSDDPFTYQQRWQTTLVEDSPDQPDCPSLGFDQWDGTELATATVDGKWVGFMGWIVSLEDGSASELEGVPVAVGNLFARLECRAAACVNATERVPFIDPATRAEKFALGREPLIPLTTDRAAMDVTADGSTLIYSGRVEWVPEGKLAVESYAIVRAVSLADGSTLWERPGKDLWTDNSRERIVIDDEAGVVFADDKLENAQSPFVALDLATGQEKYSLPIDWVCSSNGRGTAVEANSQVAVVDTSTGEQIAYTDSLGRCGDPVGSYAVQEGIVVRLLP